MSMKNVGGIFVTILSGSGVAVILGVVRWIKNIKKAARKYDVSVLYKIINFRVVRKLHHDLGEPDPPTNHDKR